MTALHNLFFLQYFNYLATLPCDKKDTYLRVPHYPSQGMNRLLFLYREGALLSKKKEKINEDFLCWKQNKIANRMKRQIYKTLYMTTVTTTPPPYFCSFHLYNNTKEKEVILSTSTWNDVSKQKNKEKKNIDEVHWSWVTTWLQLKHRHCQF